MSYNISNCTFQNNEAELGGAIYSYQGNFTGYNLTFIDNTATYYGGAYYSMYTNYENTTLLSFSGNKAYIGSILYEMVGIPTTTVFITGYSYANLE